MGALTRDLLTVFLLVTSSSLISVTAVAVVAVVVVE